MRLPQNKLQRAKAAIHGTQALLVFVAGCLTLSVMTKSGGYGGQTGFYFALVRAAFILHHHDGLLMGVNSASSPYQLSPTSQLAHSGLDSGD